MIRRAGAFLVCTAALLLFESAAPSAASTDPQDAGAADSGPIASPQAAAAPLSPNSAAPAKPTPPPPTPQQVLGDGVLIVVSLPTQRMFVFKDGALWGTSPVSTGKRGHGTPVGVFPILQKSVHHRSTIYNNAPMPYMQRLTWGGVALHAGHVPGYKASHGCIRVPAAFARKLYALTDAPSTVVLVTRAAVRSGPAALALAGAPAPAPLAKKVEMASAEPAAPAPPAPASPPPAAPAAPLVAPGVQTIQLVAAQSPQSAARYWQELVQRQPQLGSLQHEIVPAVVNSRQFYRLRASGPGAAGICSGLANAGVACLRIPS